VAEAAERLGISAHSLYAWKRQFGPDAPAHRQRMSDRAEILRVKKELKRVTAERDILKKPRRTLQARPSEVRVHCVAPCTPNPLNWAVAVDVPCAGSDPGGDYAWRRRPESDRALENRRLSGLIEQYWRESGRVYGHRKLHQDLRDAGERCGRHRVLLSGRN